MPTTVHQVSPLANEFLHFGGDCSFPRLSTIGTSFIIDLSFLDSGSSLKGASEVLIYVMFQVPDVVGTVFDSVQFKMSFELLGGPAPAHPIWLGFLETDGTWEDQTDPIPKGLAKYPTVDLFPQGSFQTDPAWVNGAASISSELRADQGFVVGDPVTWGSVGTGSTFEDDQLLTDFRTAFVANEAFRTVQGVPVLLHIFPASGFSLIFRFSSQNHTTEALRPTLTLVTPDDLGNIFDAIAISQQVDVVSMVQQLDVVVKLQQADVAAESQQADVVARTQQVDVTAEPQQVDVTAKPQEIDVVAGAEDGND